MSSDPAEVPTELARLTSAVHLVIETQATQTELLRLILEAATSDHPGGDVFSMLHEILERIDKLTELLADKGTNPSSMPLPHRER